MILEALAEALQTMAFISPEPVEGPAPAPETADLFTIRFAGDATGELQLAAPRAFGEALAINILALEPNSPEIAQRALDAVQELCNVTAGALLFRLCDTPDDVPQMGLPKTGILADALAWQQFAAQAGTTVLMAEGHPLAVRVQES